MRRPVKEDPLKPAAKCGQGTLDGACWRPGDPVKHLGPPARLQIPYWSQLLSTRCGLKASDGGWRPQARGENDDDYWCPACLTQAGIAFTEWADDQEEEQ